MSVKTLMVLLASTLLPLCASPSNHNGPVAPSILVITADDLGNQLGSYGDSTIPTPNIDALASRGTRFTRAYATQPSCSPSRSSFLSGLYPHQNGQLGLAHMGFSMTRDWPVTPRLLKEQLGYFTALAGKLHVNPSSAFAFFDALALEGAPPWTRDIDAVGEKAASYFKQAQGWPFYIQIDLVDPHPPFERQYGGLPATPISAGQVKRFSWSPATGTHGAQEIADYYNSVSRLDSIVGRVVDELRRAGRLENTVIVFWSDNGPAFPRAKTTLYEAGTRVPLVIAGPGIKAGQVRDELVSMVDIMPTVAQIAGAKMPVSNEHYSGRDLSPLLRGEQVAWRQYLFTEENFHTPEIWAPARAVTTGRWKLIQQLPVAGGTGKIQLFDLEKDPGEQTNLAGRPARRALRDHLLAELMQWRVRTADPLLDAAVFKQWQQIPVHPQEAVLPWYSPP
jgi:N-sulfoglucosamine sulfohydrolase